MLQDLLLILSLSFTANAFSESVCETSIDKESNPIFKLMREGKNPKRWKTYEAFLKKFGPCLDGAYAEGVLGLSEEALAKDWAGFTKYVRTQHPDRKALNQILMGFSTEMGDAKNLKKIQSNAKTDCPKQIMKFCTEIQKEKI